MSNDKTTEGSSNSGSRQAQPPPPGPSQQPPNGKKQTSLSRRPWLAGTLFLLFIAAVVFGVLAWIHSRTYESTDDAYIDIQSQFVSPQVSGRVARVLVKDYQSVKVDDVLVEIDPADYQNRLDLAAASRAQAQTRVAQAQAQETVYAAQVAQTEASLRVAKVNATNAANDLRRYLALRQSIAGAVSQQQLDAATTSAESSAAQVAVAEKAVAAALAQQQYAQAQVQAAQADVHSAEVQIQQAQLNLSYTRVLARLDGRIANKTVALGNFVQPGTDLMAVVPTNVYVTANFKETQLAHMRPGQPATLHVDAYPDIELRGHVDSIQPGGGQVFSVLPAQNATGNWVKIVQRVPVKIIIDDMPDDPARRLSPGLSVEARVSLAGGAAR